MTMTVDELAVLHDQIKTSTHFLEFGAGASTLFAASVPTVLQIDSVESSEEFINENLRHNPVISEAIAVGKLLFHIVDIGRTWIWGYPAGFCKKKTMAKLFPGNFFKAQSSRSGANRREISSGLYAQLYSENASELQNNDS